MSDRLDCINGSRLRKNCRCDGAVVEILQLDRHRAVGALLRQCPDFPEFIATDITRSRHAFGLPVRADHGDIL